MAHQFDTGMTLPQRTVLRRGVVALLAPLARPAGYLQALIGWGRAIDGETDHVGLDELYRALNGRSPAVVVALADRQPTDRAIGGFASKSMIELRVYFFSNHERDLLRGRLEIDAAGLASDVANPGLDVAMEHVEELLVGQRPGAVPSIKQLKFMSEEPIAAIPEATIWLQRYAVQVDRVINPNRGVTEMVKEFYGIVRTSGMTATATGGVFGDTYGDVYADLFGGASSGDPVPDPPVAQTLTDVEP